MRLTERLKKWARAVKRDGVTLWFATRHPGVPWCAKALGIFVVAYALSPIDLIPDFVPVLGYLDDVILLPGLIWLAIRMIPGPVLADCRDRADQWIKADGARPTSRAGAVFVVLVWAGATLALWYGLVGPWLGA
ncbi:MAG: hypothetical protein C0428_00445 [Polaromonas sp.]|nr:hypothetical protein [Polaromonas sp.]